MASERAARRAGGAGDRRRVRRAAARRSATNRTSARSCSPCCRPSSICPRAPLRWRACRSSPGSCRWRASTSPGRCSCATGPLSPASRDRRRSGHCTGSGPTGWGFDRLYDVVFVRPLIWFATVDKRDGIDRVYDGLAWSARTAWRALSETETGRVRWYAAGLTVGALVIITIVIFL